MTETTHHKNAEILVDRVVLTLTADRRDLAVKLCLDAIQGHVPVSTEQLTEALAAPVPEDITKRIWEIAGTLFHGEPAEWRNLVGQLIKVAHAQRAYELLMHVRHATPQAARKYLRSQITQARRSPGSRPTDDELLADCEFFGISTIGKKRQLLEALLKKAKAGLGFVEPTTCHVGGELEK
jgi:AcrR family transcriptional regulator